MDEVSSDIIKPQDIELGHLENPYQKPASNPNPDNRILPNDLSEFPQRKQDFENSRPKTPKLNTKPFMPIPKRIIIMSLILLVIGTSFLISGLVDYYEGDRERGIAFIVFGCLMFIPGLYYTYQVYLACVAGTPEERQEILEDIPQIEY